MSTARRSKPGTCGSRRTVCRWRNIVSSDGQFDVYAGPGAGFLLDCQSDLLADFRTRFVVPLTGANAVPTSFKGLHPTFEIEGRHYVMATHLAATVATRDLGRTVTSLAAHAHRFTNALDFLITGF